MTTKWDTVLNTLLVCAALMIAGLAVRREVLPAPVGLSESFDKPHIVHGWEEALRTGVSIGDSGAKVHIVEFGDLECPACRNFEAIIESVLTQRRRDVSLVYVHFPLQMHRFALPAARAAECARVQGGFGAWVRTVYAHQDSLGLLSWDAMALRAGLSDTASIRRCAESADPVGAIAAGIALGKKLGVNSTPTVMVNGWMFPGFHDPAELNRVIDSLLIGRPPFPP